ncbi:HAD hydrolase-like protein [Litchfieldia alkalitelluris]|uniref:HAD hydrolase-like protein n=1 Tax=Litchfieldia alkalitelluris TaxID=304268 RepID=UPI00099605E5|nr:HAD hydrolase-like protein [Litchfieldia alkalitelluris]
MLKYIIFDFDGTIADSKKAFVASWNSLADTHKFSKIKDSQLDELKKLSIKERGKLLNFPLYKLPIVLPQFYKSYRNSMHEITLFNGIRELLYQLECKGYNTAIISSNSKDNISTFLKQNQIENVTTILCSSSIFGKDKLINKFLKENNLTSNEVIYVGDEHRDIVACKKTGVKIIWVGWGYDSIEVVQQANPDYKVNAPKEILEIV